MLNKHSDIEYSKFSSPEKLFERKILFDRLANDECFGKSLGAYARKSSVVAGCLDAWLLYAYRHNGLV
jgi:hypothetical protein